jgi:hypothetical protein
MVRYTILLPDSVIDFFNASTIIRFHDEFWSRKNLGVFPNSSIEFMANDRPKDHCIFQIPDILSVNNCDFMTDDILVGNIIIVLLARIIIWNICQSFRPSKQHLKVPDFYFNDNFTKIVGLSPYDAWANLPETLIQDETIKEFSNAIGLMVNESSDLF